MSIFFDDSYTATSLNLHGRASHDLLDQQLFQARLGHASVVILARVDQVWDTGRHQGARSQRLELRIGEVLLGRLPSRAPERVVLESDTGEDPPALQTGANVLLFLRWDPKSEPPYHFHLMPAGGHGRLADLREDDVIALIQAMAKHARDEGVLDAHGEVRRNKWSAHDLAPDPSRQFGLVSPE